MDQGLISIEKQLNSGSASVFKILLLVLTKY